MTTGHRKLLVGLVGAGIQRSLSPALHEAEAAHHGIRLHYQLVDVAQPGARSATLAKLLEAAAAVGFAGLNITFPFKQEVVALLDELSPEARSIGAVNTVQIREGRFIGHNTDGPGWSWAFRRALPDADLAAPVLVGAGGAGAAVADALLRLGAPSLRIVDVNARAAESLAQRLDGRFDARISAHEDVAEAFRGASGVVHASPTGMLKHPGIAFDPALLQPRMWVSEVVYVPLETELLRAARARGCRVVDGGGMAVGQAARAFELFTGQAADGARMLGHFARLANAAA